MEISPGKIILEYPSSPIYKYIYIFPNLVFPFSPSLACNLRAIIERKILECCRIYPFESTYYRKSEKYTAFLNLAKAALPRN
jgi:hypothetical protein